MRNPLLTLGLALILGFSALEAAATWAQETTLSANQMALIFGGDDPNHECCQTDPNCTGNGIGVCSAYNGDETGCRAGAKAYNNTQYARKCGMPESCPTCDCTNYVKDKNGKTYNCIDWYFCNYAAGQCTQGKYSNSTAGTFSCADNCVP